MDGVVSPVISTNMANQSSFYKSVYSFATSIGFPHKFVKGAAELNVSEVARIQLVNFLLSEYQSCKMIGPQEPIYSKTMTTAQNIRLNENEKLISKYLGDTCNVLSVECPDSAPQTVQNIQQQIKTVISKLRYFRICCECFCCSTTTCAKYI